MDYHNLILLCLDMDGPLKLMNVIIVVLPTIFMYGR